MPRPHPTLALLIGLGSLLPGAADPPRLVPVRQAQGMQHGFLTLTSLDGTTVADGDALQTISGDHIVSRTIFKFRDGSLNDETTTFTQHGVFRLTNYHLVQRGATFDPPIDMAIDMAHGHVVVHYTGSHGEPKVDDEQMKLPPDIANGLLITLLQNVTAADLPLTVSLLAATPTPRLVKLVVSAAGTAPFSIGNMSMNATDYLVKTEIGGIAGFVAPLVGKQPPDSHVWILGGEAPAFVKSESPMAAGGPLLRTELTNPHWPR